MRIVVALLILAATACAAEPQVHRDLPYAGTKNKRQTLDVYAPTEGKGIPSPSGFTAAAGRRATRARWT